MGVDLLPESTQHCSIQRSVKRVLGEVRNVVLGEGLSVKVESSLASDLVCGVRIDNLVPGDEPPAGHLVVEEADRKKPLALDAHEAELSHALDC